MSGVAALPGVNTPPWSLEPERAVIGVDPSTRRMSAAVLVPYNQRDSHAFVVSTLSLPQLDGNESRRLALQQTEIVPWMGGLLARWDPEGVVIETPFAFGRQVPSESFHVIGILLAVIGQFDVRVARMGPGEWKRAALGAGNGGLKKPTGKCPKGGKHTWPFARVYGDGGCLKCGEPAYGVLTWARAAGYDGTLWDEADAVGIATAGGVLLERESRPNL